MMTTPDEEDFQRAHRESLREWFVFGHYPPDRRFVDIADIDGDVLQHVPIDVAEAWIERHNAALLPPESK